MAWEGLDFAGADFFLATGREVFFEGAGVAREEFFLEGFIGGDFSCRNVKFEQADSRIWGREVAIQNEPEGRVLGSPGGVTATYFEGWHAFSYICFVAGSGALEAAREGHTAIMENKATNNKKSESNGPLIVVADDELVILEIVEVILRNEGYTVSSFQKPEEALEAVKTGALKPVLLITDYSMGDMNGLQLITGCREVLPEIRTMLVSGTVSENILKSSGTHADAFLAKPFKVSALLELVQSLAGRPS